VIGNTHDDDDDDEDEQEYIKEIRKFFLWKTDYESK
jgi:hypothetical protein